MFYTYLLSSDKIEVSVDPTISNILLIKYKRSQAAITTLVAIPINVVSGKPGAKVTKDKCTPFSKRQRPITTLIASLRAIRTYNPNAKIIKDKAKQDRAGSTIASGVGATNSI
jgi:hypothetical protein